MGTREERLAALKARLEHVEDSTDPSGVMGFDALLEAWQLQEALGDKDPEGWNALGWFYWYRHLAAQGEESHRDLDAALDMLTPCFIINGPANLPQPLLPMLAERAAAKVTPLFRAMLNSDQAMVLEAVKVWQRIVEAIGAGHPGRPDYLAKLGMARWFLYKHSGGTVEDLRNVITALVDARSSMSTDDIPVLVILLTAQFTLIQRTGKGSDLESAIAP